MRLFDAVRRANQPGPPEGSAALRLAATGAVLVGIGACLAEGELSTIDALASGVLLCTGMLFSHLTRERPVRWVKPVLAAVMIAAFVWFFHAVSSATTTGQAGALEAPLAVLFVWIQVAHSFDVPARRDIAFSLAGSAALMAVAASEALTLRFGLFVVAWALLALTGLGASWASMSHARRPAMRQVALAGAGALSITALAVLVLPAPKPSSRLVFPSSLAGDLPVSDPGGLAGNGTHATEPARAATPSGATRVGGFLGLAGPLDTALRPSLGNEVVMRVRAQRPTYWIGEVYDHWNGQSWSDPHPGTRELTSGSPFQIPLPTGDTGGGSSDLQTFYLTVNGPNLVFHASDALEVWFPERDLYVTSNGSIRTGVGMGAGTVYTVLSSVNQATPAELETVPAGPSAYYASPPGQRKALPESTKHPFTFTVEGFAFSQDLQLPRAYHRASALARRVTHGATSRYAEVEDLIGWIGAHTHYSLDIPPLKPGQDSVNEFLFGNRTGFCEQIATSLAVMLRSLGIPARVAAGYVPGSYDPITDLWQVEAKDAHAWVQVWFPGFGWQSFDPTAVVPLANPSPGSVLLHQAIDGLKRIPPVPTGSVLGVLGVAALLYEWRRRRPRTWAERVARDIERLGRRSGRPRRPAETLSEYATELSAILPEERDSLLERARRAEQSAYSPVKSPSRSTTT